MMMLKGIRRFSPALLVKPANCNDLHLAGVPQLIQMLKNIAHHSLLPPYLLWSSSSSSSSTSFSSSNPSSPSSPSSQCSSPNFQRSLLKRKDRVVSPHFPRLCGTPKAARSEQEDALLARSLVLLPEMRPSQVLQVSFGFFKAFGACPSKFLSELRDYLMAEDIAIENEDQLELAESLRWDRFSAIDIVLLIDLISKHEWMDLQFLALLERKLKPQLSALQASDLAILYKSLTRFLGKGSYVGWQQLFKEAFILETLNRAKLLIPYASPSVQVQILGGISSLMRLKEEEGSSISNAFDKLLDEAETVLVEILLCFVSKKFIYSGFQLFGILSFVVECSLLEARLKANEEESLHFFLKGLNDKLLAICEKRCLKRKIGDFSSVFLGRGSNPPIALEESFRFILLTFSALFYQLSEKFQEIPDSQLLHLLHTFVQQFKYFDFKSAEGIIYYFMQRLNRLTKAQLYSLNELILSASWEHKLTANQNPSERKENMIASDCLVNPKNLIDSIPNFNKNELSTEEVSQFLREISLELHR